MSIISRHFVLHIEQTNLRNTNDIKWLEVVLTSPRVSSPFAPLAGDEEKYEWLAKSDYEVNTMWGTWYLGANSTTLAVDTGKTLGAPSSNRFESGYRYNSPRNELEFVELWHISSAPDEIHVAARLYDCHLKQTGFWPHGNRGGEANGYIDIGSAILVRGSLRWSFKGPR